MASDTITVTSAKQSRLGKRLGIPAGQNMVWWLIGKQRNPRSQLLASLGFIAIFWLAYHNPWSAIAMMMAMYVHEIGHYVVFVSNKIKATVLLLFPLGAVAVPVNKEEDTRSDLLPWWNIGWLLQAGPTMNVLQMVVGLIFIQINFLPVLAGQMIFINGLLCLFNLLPLVNMDGGQLFHVIFSSLKEKGDVLVGVFAIVVSVLVIGLILLTPLGQGTIGVIRALFYNSGLIFFLILMVTGIWHKQGKDHPLHSKSLQAMTSLQVVIQLVYYVLLVVITFFLLSI